MNWEFIKLLASFATGIGVALLVYFLNRARPRADITDIALYAPYCAAEEQVLIQDRIHGTTKKIFVTPKEAVEVCLRNKYLEPFSLDYAYYHPQSYINFIYGALSANEYWRVQYHNMLPVITQIRIDLDSSLKESLRTFAHYHAPIWNELLRTFVRQEFDFSLTDSAGEKSFHRINPIEIAQATGWGVVVDGIPMYFQFNRDYSGPKDEILRFAHKLAKAIAWHDIAALKQVLDFLEEVDWRSSIFDETEKVLRDQVEKSFSRIIVRGLLIDKGRTAYAVAGAAKMRLYMKGFSYESQETGRHESLHMDIEMRMRCVDETYLRSVPTLAVNPGTAEPFLAVSEDYLRDMVDREAIKAAFASERQCQIEFALTERGIEPRRDIKIEPFFRRLLRRKGKITSRACPVRTVRIGTGEYQI
jgi:hypothetical protein